MALQVVAEGRYLVYPDLAQALDDLLQGREPEGVELSV